MTVVAEVVEYTDPGCIWSWSSEPWLRWLRERYDGQLAWRRVFGVQVDDLARTSPGRDPVADADEFRAAWLDVAAHTRAPIADQLAWFHRSTIPASRAAKAAERQVVAAGAAAGGATGPTIADAVLRRLREAVFVTGRPADDDERIAAALRGIPDLDLARLLADAGSAEVAQAIDADWARTRRPRPEVIDRTGPGPNPGAAKPDGEHLRYGFPTLVVTGSGGTRVLAGWRDPLDHAAELEAAAPELAARPVGTAPAAEALARYGSLTTPELELLTADAAAGLPADALRIETATTPLWLSAAEAAARGLAATGAAA